MELWVDLKLIQVDIVDYEIMNIVVICYNKVIYVYLQQQYVGILVCNVILNMNIMENGEVFSMGNCFIFDLFSQVNIIQLQISMEIVVRKLMVYVNVNSSVLLSIDW